MLEDPAGSAEKRGRHGNSANQSMSAPTRIGTPRVAVTGATGEGGSRVAQLLAARGVAQRLPVRAARRAPRPAHADVVEVGGYEDRRGMVAALEGIETLLLIPGHEAADRVDAHRAAIQAAAEAGVERVVQLSFVGAAPDATFTYARDHWQTEQDLKASGLEWTIARMNFYLDVLPQFVLTSGEIAGPAADGRVAVVALALVELLTGQDHEGMTYELTGPEALSFRQIAATMNRSNRHTISYRPETVEEAVASRAAIPASDKEREGWVSTYTAVAAGELEHVTDDVERLTGEPPMVLAEWLRAYPFSLVHVGADFSSVARAV
jgi:NAD(P)H dehydrogenase (quinone)